MKRNTIIILILLFSASAFAQQQGISSDGLDFYLGFVYPSFNKNPSIVSVSGWFNVYALISSYDNNQVTVSYFDATGHETQGGIYSISGKSSVQVALDLGAMHMTEPGDTAEYKACHIRAKKPVTVQYFSTGACSGGSYLALQTSALGKKYVIASYNDNPGNGAYISTQKENAGGFFMIIAPFDSTNITITPTGLTAGGHRGLFPYQIKLNRGQCYWVKGDGSDSRNDLSGSTVTSTKPISVLAGHEDAFLGSVDGKTIDGRNFMIQQMIPAEYFASDGYVSIPRVDCPGFDVSDPGFGENYRVYTFDSNKISMQAFIQGNSGITLASEALTPPPEIQNAGTPAEFHSHNGNQFSVMAYDLRQQGDKDPYPAPSMMTVVPMQNWKYSYLFYIPTQNLIIQDYYINVIAERKDFAQNIKYSHNGSTLAPITTLSLIASFQNIPNHPELSGNTYKVHQGTYYFTNTRTTIDPTVPIDTLLQGAFIVYQYGMSVVDPENDLAFGDGDDFFFEYASPAGMRLLAGAGNPKARVDTLCTGWHICLSDSIPLESATIINDPDGNVYGKPGKQSFNVSFSPKEDSTGRGEIVFSGNDTAACIDVIVNNPLDSAYAPIYIVDKAGYHLIVELHFHPQKVQLLLAQPEPTLTYIKIDTLKFPLTKVGQQICSTIVYVNTAPKGGPAFRINKLELKNPNFVFNPVPAAPVTLLPGDTLRANICFPAIDTLTYIDTLVATTDCAAFPLPIVGQGGTALIYATDIDFGNVLVGTTKCLPVTVSNRGSFPFTLTKNWLLHDNTKFSMDPANAAALPVVIPPGGHANITFCYIPQAFGAVDSTTVDWSTDIEGAYKDQIKSWSYLRGKPVKPGLIWDRPSQFFIADSVAGIDSVIRRVYLINNGTGMAQVERVFIAGADSAEFHIIGNQLGFTPLGNFSIQAGDSIWIDVLFKPDLTKPYPQKFADRNAVLIATLLNEISGGSDSVTMNLIGTWRKDGVDAQSKKISLSIHPNPATGNSIIISLPNAMPGNSTLVIYDILGREVYRQNIQTVGDLDIPIAQLQPGSYLARIVSGSWHAEKKFEILR